MIEIEALTKRYASLTAVGGLSVTIRDGLIYGFLGANGAGKSTTLGMLTGCIAPTSGSIRIDGYDLRTQPLEAKRRIGYLPEIPPLYMEMTPLEYLRFVARARGLGKSEQAAAIERALRKTQTFDVRNRVIRQLSKGYRQRVGLAQAILGEPKIIILDEPTVGLDPNQVVEVRELIRELGKSHTVLFSSHILSEVSLLCDRVLIIDHGKLLCEDTPQALSARLRTEETLMLTVLDPEGKAQALLRAISGVHGAEKADDESGGRVRLHIRMEPDDAVRQRIAVALTKAGIAVLDMQTQQGTLEDAFLRLTQEVEP